MRVMLRSGQSAGAQTRIWSTGVVYSLSVLFSPRKYELSQVLGIRGDGLAGALVPWASLTTATMQTRALPRARSTTQCHVSCRRMRTGRVAASETGVREEPS